MDSPVRKMLKKNDYNRHKLLRKIKRQREAEKEQLAHVAEKELKRKLRKPKYEDGKDTYKYNFDSSAFDQNGNLKPELEVTTPEVVVTGDAWRLLDKIDRTARAEQRLFLQSEIGPDGKLYPGHGALLQVSPEFDLITVAPLLKNAAQYAGSKLASQANKLHIGNYYLNPQYNNLSYIRLVGDDAIEDMLRTGQMRSTRAVNVEQRPWDEFRQLWQGYGDDIKYSNLSRKERWLADFENKAGKVFQDLMFYTGRPFYRSGRYNYIIKQPQQILKQKELSGKGIEWIESTHKGHTSHAKNYAIKNGEDPNVAPGRIVVPLYNGDKNIIPLSEFGEFDLYLPMSVGRIKLPIYKKRSFNK